jgi:hypothetical protein
VATGVVGDQAVAALDEVPRALNDVAARCREPVQQHDRSAVTGLLAAEDDAVALDLERSGFHGPTL